MTSFVQAIAGALVAVVLCAAVSRQGRDISLLLSVAVCCMVLGLACGYLEPVIDFARALKDTAQMDDELFRVVLKAVGIGMTAQITAMICADCGNGAIGKTVELLGTAAILWLALPMMQSLLELVEQMMGSL